MDKSINPKSYLIDGKFEATHYFKDIHKKRISEMDIETIKAKANASDTVTLFHGTTTAHLNDILSNGLRPRIETKIDNWGGELTSLENVVYMTNKWHYLYAYQATDSYLKEKHKGEGRKYEPWWECWESYPCYIECTIPKALLVADEDFFHSKYISQKIKSAVKRNLMDVELNWNDSLSQYGTAGVLGGISPSQIKSFSILGERKLFYELMLSESTYNKDAVAWGAGKGKGKLKLFDIQKREDSSLENGAWFIKDMPKGKQIQQIGINPASKTLAISFQK
jgi:hypothetical protein